MEATGANRLVRCAQQPRSLRASCMAFEDEMTEVERRCISDDQAVLFTKGLSVLIVSVFSLVGIVGLILREPHGAMMLLVAAIVGVKSRGIWWESAHVEMDDINLYIRAKSGEVTLSRSDIDRVLEMIGSHNFITVTFKGVTDVGRQVKFIARAEDQAGLWKSHPIVRELRKGLRTQECRRSTDVDS